MAVGRDLRSGCGDVAHPRSQDREYAAGKMNDAAPSMKTVAAVVYEGE
jgi:hypothetical protein